MCGITGACWTDSRLAIDQGTLNRMVDVLAHRGPDDRGSHLENLSGDIGSGVALGHRRLSVIDVAGGAQPMSNEDDTVYVVFNGEIYNYLSLRRRLEGTGHRFRTRSDTEVLVHLYEQSGNDAFAQLNGMFAVAIWDRPRQRLVLARDRLGQKPLVYALQDGRLAFASELKSLLQIADLPRELDATAVDQYLTYQYVPHPRTIFQAAKKLPPAHFAVFEEGRLRSGQYWQPPSEVDAQISEAGAIDQLRELVGDSVRLRMQSDVPLGAFLSGGVDSSLVVSLMQQFSEKRIKTFSIGFPHPEYDESRYARQVARALGTDHNEYIIRPDAVEAIHHLVELFDEPFADSSAIPTWHLSKLAREQVTVVLTGDGGDELFCGYPRYRAVESAERMPGGLRQLLSWPLWQRAPTSTRQRSVWRQAKRFAEAASLSPERRYLDWISIFNEPRRAGLYQEDFLTDLSEDPATFLHSAWHQSKHGQQLAAAAYADLITYLPCDLLAKVDMNSMAHGLEARQPLLDHRVVELAMRLPTAMKYRGGRGKRILRKAFHAQIPNRIWRRKKMGFGVPLDHWFRKELRPLTQDILLSKSTRVGQFCRPQAVEQLVREHQQGVFDHSYRLWSLLFFELWLQKWA